MKLRALLFGLTLAGVTLAAACSGTDDHGASARKPARNRNSARQPDAKDTTAHGAKQPNGHGHGHDHGPEPEGVPAFVVDAASLKSLAPTLSPDLFSGRQRLGYQAARAIPQTIAQLPCYCHCDKGFGHKSLHSCFVDDHAAHCAVCLDEALLAYQLETQQKLKPEQIRERIIAQYSSK